MTLTHLRTALVALMLSGGAEASLDVLVLHNWVSEAESRSLIELKILLQKQNVVFRDIVIPEDGSPEAVNKRANAIMADNLLTAADMKFTEIGKWNSRGYLLSLDDMATHDDWFSKSVIDHFKVNEEYIALPINIRQVNRIWANKKLLDELQITIPETWKDFLITAAKIENTGVKLITMSNSIDEVLTLFELVALGVGGIDFYKSVFINNDLDTIASPLMLEVLDIFTQLIKLANLDFSKRSDWTEASLEMINDQAVFNITSNMIKEKFDNANKIIGKDFICIPAPGTRNIYSYSNSAFAMLKSDDSTFRMAQYTLGKALLSKDFQIYFNRQIGSLPIIKLDLETSNFDACTIESQNTLEIAEANRTLVPSFSQDMFLPKNPKLKDAFSNITYALAKGNLNPHQAISEFVLTLHPPESS